MIEAKQAKLAEIAASRGEVKEENKKINERIDEIDQREGDHQETQEIPVYLVETADASEAETHIGQMTQSPSNACAVNVDALAQKDVWSEFVAKEGAFSRVIILFSGPETHTRPLSYSNVAIR